MACAVRHGVPALSVREVIYQNVEIFPNIFYVSRDLQADWLLHCKNVKVLVSF
jgi:hypothetical protein